MGANRLTGPGAGAEKYDILTALAVAGLSGAPGVQSTMLRLIALVTARYNWARDELSVGQRDMAEMWSVNERTAKREVKRMLDGQLLILKRAGVRGRVATYRLNVSHIYRLSEPVWQRVGPDFAERMDQRQPKPVTTIVRVDFQTRTAERPQGDGTPWQRVLDRLALENLATFNAWYSKLKLRRAQGGEVFLEAPSNFVAQYIQTHFLPPLVTAIKAEYGSEIELRLLAP